MLIISTEVVLTKLMTIIDKRMLLELVQKTSKIYFIDQMPRTHPYFLLSFLRQLLRAEDNKFSNFIAKN